MRIFIVTGDPSGDLHGAHLAQALREQDPLITLRGVGGVRMRRAGVELVAESDHWGAIGIAAAVCKVPYLLRQISRLAALLRADPPDVLVLIDFGAFNVALLKKLRGSGIRSVYFIPPGSWSRDRKPGKLPFLLEGIATPFPWSAENLRGAGAPARIEWVGHPLLDYCREAATREEARARLGISSTQPVLALVPGSRQLEVRYLLDAFLAAAQQLTPAPLVLLAVAPSLQNAPQWRALPAGLEIRRLEGLDYSLLPAADAALSASGTATLELACLRVPLVAAYRCSLFGELEARVQARGWGLRYFALPNILAAARVVPEFFQREAHPAALAAALTPLLSDTPERRAQLESFTRLRDMLGTGHACERTATMIREIALSSG
jgi:lipid-A-disaccharide synthase